MMEGPKLANIIDSKSNAHFLRYFYSLKIVTEFEESPKRHLFSFFVSL